VWRFRRPHHLSAVKVAPTRKNPNKDGHFSHFRRFAARPSRLRAVGVILSGFSTARVRWCWPDATWTQHGWQAVTYRLRKSDVLQELRRYWHGRGDRTYTLSSDLRAWWEYPQPRRLPPLSAEERAAFDKVQERRRRIHPLDRAAALERWGPLPKPAPVAPVAEKEKPQPKPKKRKGGRPPNFDHTAIKRFAKNIMRKKNKPDTMALLMEKVGDACDAARPCIKKPGPTQFKAIVGPIFRKHGHKSP
jgi:hypothetical protein